MPENPDAVVIGVDLGILSGRAVVERELPGTGEKLPPDRALQMPAVERIAGTRPVPSGRKVS
jgi:hypothetical protein